MHLSRQVTVKQSAEQVWALLSDPYFLAEWDKSVETVLPISQDSGIVGFRFDTIAPKKKGQSKPLRMSYRIIGHIPGQETKIQLENSPMFSKAIWTMRVEPAAQGALITCEVDLKVKLRYFFMVPLLFFNRGALQTDLHYLREAIRRHHVHNYR
jgi:hypothetical protein